MGRTLIRVDRNGTKYFADDTCKRCGGADDYDYSPSAPWKAPGMKVSDFITGVSWR